MGHETGRPFLPGDNIASSAQTGLGLEKWGFGVPGGAPKPTRTLRITPRDWFQNRVSFDRPCLLVPDEDFTGVLYVFECNTAPGYCPGSANNLFSARKYRRGQTCFINRPGRYSLYFDDPRQTLQLLEYDWGSIWNDDPATKYLTGWDPALPGFRGVGVTATDPAALLVSDLGGGAGLAALIALLAPLLTPAPAVVNMTTPAPTGVDSLVLPALAGRKFTSIYNNGPVTVYIRTDGGVATVADMALIPGAYYYIEATSGIINDGAIHAITAGGVGSLAIEEWS